MTVLHNYFDIAQNNCILKLPVGQQFIGITKLLQVINNFPLEYVATVTVNWFYQIGLCSVI